MDFSCIHSYKLCMIRLSENYHISTFLLVNMGHPLALWADMVFCLFG